MKKFILLLIIILFPLYSFSHPSSYEGGLDLMGSSHSKYQNLELVYSPKYWLGTGLVLERSPKLWESIAIQLGLLVKRWNLPAAQGNLYILAGPGYGSKFNLKEDKDTDLLYRVGAQADYETRQIYTFVKYTEQRFFSSNNHLYKRLELRAGFAPYLAKFTELNSWLILKTIFINDFKDVIYVPTARLFYKNFLIDLGVDLDGGAQLNFMVRN